MKSFMIFNVSEIYLINFDEVLETSPNTVRKSLDGTKTFVKWVGEIPPSVSSLTTKEGPYNEEEIMNILRTEEWTMLVTIPGSPPVPNEVSTWRIRAIITVMGLDNQVISAIETMEEPNKTIAKFAWFQGGTIERNSPTVLFIASSLNLTKEQVDNIFIQASEIVI